MSTRENIRLIARTPFTVGSLHTVLSKTRITKALIRLRVGEFIYMYSLNY